MVVEPLEIEARPVRMSEGEHPLGWLVETSHAVEHRSLAGPIRSDQGSDVAAAYLERHIVDRGQAAEAHGDVFDLEEWVLLPSRHARPHLRKQSGLANLGRPTLARGHLRRWQRMQMRVLTRMALQHIQGDLFSSNVARPHP